MAQKNKNKVKARKVTTRKARARVQSMSVARPVQQKMLAYAHLLNDPCQGPIQEGIYPGEQGFVQRFSANSVAAIGASTVYLVAYYPAANAFVSVALASTTTPYVVNWAVSAALSPGHAFLQPVTDKSRAHAACIEAGLWNQAVTAITGTVSVGVFSYSYLAQATNLAGGVNDLLNQLSPPEPLIRTSYECKWAPGSFDNRFSTYGTLSATDASDQNVVVMVFSGLAANAEFRVRMTAVHEYTGKPLSGLVPNATDTAVGIDHNAVTSALKARNANWFHNLKTEAWSALKGYAVSGMKEVGPQVAKFAGKALLGGLALL